MAKTATIQAQQRWEYVSIVKRTDTALASELNELGKSGWELVSVIYGKDRKGELAWNGFLKRPATQHPHATSAEAQSAEASPAAKEERAEPAEASDEFDLSGDEFKLQD